MATKQMNDTTYTRYETTAHRVGMLLDLVSDAAASNAIRSAAQRARCGEVSTANELELLNLVAIGSELMGLIPSHVADTMAKGFTYAQATTEIGTGGTVAEALAAGALTIEAARAAVR